MVNNKFIFNRCPFLRRFRDSAESSMMWWLSVFKWVVVINSQLLGLVNDPKSSWQFWRPRVAEDVRRHERPLQKSLDLDENLKHLHALFCPIIKICRDLRTFWKTWCNKVPFGDNNSVSWARSESLYGVCCILHWIKFAKLKLRTKTTYLSWK